MESLTSTISIDGSQLEGGGQIVRAAMAISSIMRTPIIIDAIRRGREKPGLAAQHLEGIRLAMRISEGIVDGQEIGSEIVHFQPGQRRLLKSYTSDCRTAGAISLLVQISLPCVCLTSEGHQGSIHFDYGGGTNVPKSPPCDHVQVVMLPLLKQLGINASANIQRRGFYPRGGGRLQLEITPIKCLTSIDMTHQGELLSCQGVVFGNASDEDTALFISELRRFLGENPITSINGNLISEIAFPGYAMATPPSSSSPSVMVPMEKGRKRGHDDHAKGGLSAAPMVGRSSVLPPPGKKGGGPKEVITMGALLSITTTTGCVLSSNNTLQSKKGVPLTPEEITGGARGVVEEIRELVASRACVDEYTADQLVVYMALARGTSRLLLAPPSAISSLHLATVTTIAHSLTGAEMTLTDVEVDSRTGRILNPLGGLDEGGKRVEGTEGGEGERQDCVAGAVSAAAVIMEPMEGAGDPPSTSQTHAGDGGGDGIQGDVTVGAPSATEPLSAAPPATIRCRLLTCSGIGFGSQHR